MTVERTPHSEVWTLFEAACNGTIDTEQTERLDAILHEDEQACDSYLLYMRIHAQLFRTFCLERCRDKVLQSIQAPHSAASPAISDQENKQHAGSDSEIVPPPTFGVFSHILHGTVGFFSQEIPFSLLIATVLTALGLLAGSLVHVTHHQQLAHDASQSSGIFPSRTTAPSDLKYIGRVTGMANVQWADINTSTEKGNGVPLGRKYALASGLMEITYDTGATVILQGPVTYEVDSRDGGFLSIGKLTARLEKKRSGVGGQGSEKVTSGQQAVASGQWSVASKTNPKSQITKSQISNPSSSPAPAFAVRTPTATVTDLGTEFGVEVDARGITTSYVFRGEIQFASVGGPQNNDARQALILHANQSARTEVQSDRAVRALAYFDATHPQKFVRVMPASAVQAATKSTPSETYAALVLSLHPVMYYRMNRAEQDSNYCVLFDSAPRHRHGTVHLGTATGLLWMPGRFGDAMHLRGPMIGDYAVVDDYPPTQNNTLTVAAWVYAESSWPPWATIAKNWGNSKIGQFHFGLSDKDECLHAYLCQADGIRIEVREKADRPMPTGVWQHVALVVNGATARLYRNGYEVAAAACRGLQYPPPVTKLAIGCKLNNEGSEPDAVNPGFWRGCIDELAIFHRELPLEAIQQLALQKPIKPDLPTETSLQDR